MFALPQVRKWRRQEELTLSGRGCARAPLSLLPQQAPALACLLHAPLLPLLPLPQLQYIALLLLMLRVPPLWSLPRGDIITGLGPLHPILHILSHPGGPHRPRGPGLLAQESNPFRDPGCHPLHRIRVLSEP